MRKIAAMVVVQLMTTIFEKLSGAIRDYFKRRKEAKERQERDRVNQDAANRSAEATTPEEARRIGDELP